MEVPVVQGMVQGEGQVLPPVRAGMGSPSAWSVHDAGEFREVGVGGSGSQVARSPRGPCWIAGVIGRDVDRGRRDAVWHRGQSFDKGKERGSRRVSFTGGGVECTRCDTRHDPDCTRIARADREQEANACSDEAHRSSCGWLQSVGREVQDTTRSGPGSVQTGVSGVIESRRGSGPVDARVGGPGRGAGQSAVWTGGGDTSCGSHGAGQVHVQDLGRHEEVPQQATRSCERNGDVIKTLVEGVACLETSSSQQAGDEMELEESKAKQLRMVQKQPIQPHLDQVRGEPQHTTASTVLIAESLDMEGHME